MQSRKLKVLQVHNRQKMLGGADVVIEREASLLRAHGHDVDLFTVDSKELQGMASWKVARNVIWNPDAASRLRKRLTEDRPDLIHVHTIFPVMSPVVFRVAKKLGVPTVETMHNFRLVCPGGLLKRNGSVCEKCVGKKIPIPAVVHGCYRNSRVHSIGMAATMTVHHAMGTFSKCIDRYVALTDFVRRMMIRGGYPEEKIVVKPNFVINDQPVGDGSGGFALFVGRFHPEKGVMTAVRAWKLLKNAPKLIMIGDGPEREDVLRESQGLNIEVHDWKTSPEVLEMMRAAKFLVFPSEWYEAGPLVPLESFSCGTPVVASDIGNFSEWIEPDQNGYLFQTGNPQSLADVVEKAIEKDRFAEMRPIARKLFEEKYSPEANYIAMMQLYQSILPATERA